MTITFDKIKQSKPLLIVYSPGTGGEFIASVLSKSSPDFIPLEIYFYKDINRYKVICATQLSYRWKDIENPETWINPDFTSSGCENLRYILKDHPSTKYISGYKAHLPDIEIIYIMPYSTAEYFSKLAFIKAIEKIDFPLTPKYVRDNVSPFLSTERINKLIEWATKYSYIWSSELHAVNYHLDLGYTIDNMPFKRSMHSYIKDHAYSIYRQYVDVCYELEKEFKNVHIINSDTLTVDSTNFWIEISKFINLDLESAIKTTNIWIQQNTQLINNFNHVHNFD